jgi:hypothetical protein
LLGTMMMKKGRMEEGKKQKPTQVGPRECSYKYVFSQHKKKDWKTKKEKERLSGLCCLLGF